MIGDKMSEFIGQLDHMQAGADWGTELSKRLDCRFMKDDEFAASRVENLTAGFSNLCHLDCPFCVEHNSPTQKIPLKELPVERLIELFHGHKKQTGNNIGRFHIGNTGEPLLHERFIDLVLETAE